MPDINLCFEVHQPLRLRPHYYKRKDKDLVERYFDTHRNEGILRRVVDKCYMPANNIILKNLENLRDFKVTFSISGVLLDQFEKYFPHMIDSFQWLADTGQVEFMGQTYHHSLASLYDDMGEFEEQVDMHSNRIRDLFGQKPSTFENTEFIYNNKIAQKAEQMGFKGIFTEGIDHIMGWRSPNYLYHPPRSMTSRIKTLVRNYRMSDDIGYRFSARWWDQWPLTAEKYAAWLSATPGDVMNIFIDYETFGEHQWPETGIFGFLGQLPHEVLKYPHLRFTTPSEAVDRHESKDEIDVFELSSISWADMERDTSAWLGNEMQRHAFEEIRNLGQKVKQNGDKEMLRIWRYLQNSDHLYYICTKHWADGDVHKYFSGLESPKDSYDTILKIVSELKQRL